eukprot:361323-Chlamydomonas_euryale.AAC.17
MQLIQSAHACMQHVDASAPRGPSTHQLQSYIRVAGRACSHEAIAPPPCKPQPKGCPVAACPLSAI